MQIDSIWSTDQRTDAGTSEIPIIKVDPDRILDNRKRPRDHEISTFEQEQIIQRFQVRKVDCQNRIDVHVRYDCTQCLTCFSTQSDLLLHQRIHHGHPDLTLQQNKVCIYSGFPAVSR